LIYVPFMAGEPGHPVSQAPARYTPAGAERWLAGLGLLPVCAASMPGPARALVWWPCRLRSIRSCRGWPGRRSPRAGCCWCWPGLARPRSGSRQAWTGDAAGWSGGCPHRFQHPAVLSQRVLAQHVAGGGDRGTATAGCGHRFTAARRSPGNGWCWPAPALAGQGRGGAGPPARPVGR